MNILWLNEIKRESIELVGKKAFELSELYAKGFPVPQGFVITTEAFKEFLDFSGLTTTIIDLTNNLDIEDNRKLINAVEKIQDLILRAPIPEYLRNEILREYGNLNVDPDTFNHAMKAINMIRAGRESPYVALRPSVMAGLKPETFLDVKGVSSLLDSIKKCWALAYNKNLIYQRAKNNISADYLFSVIVQKQIRPDKSGFVSVKNNEIVIKSNFGLIDSIESNLVIPDNYVVNKNNFLIKNIEIGSKEFIVYFDDNIKENSRRILGVKSKEQVLNETEINKIVDISIKLEDFYKKLFNIEFAIRTGSISVINIDVIDEIEVKEEIKTDDFIPETITKIRVDLDDSIDSDKALDADGAFIRLESIIKKREINPLSLVRENEYYYTSILLEELELVTKSFKDKDIFIRTSDLVDENEKNPLIGFRGIRRALDENIILKAEFNVIKKLNESGYKTKIVFPFISNVDELRQAKDLMREIGINNDIGIMLETPASCETIDYFCKEGIKFIIFGTDNLTQLILGVDNSNDKISKSFNEKHPALLRNIQKVIGVCKQFNVETNLVGSITSDVEMIDFLVGIGIDSIMVKIDDIMKVKSLISRTEKRIIIN